MGLGLSRVHVGASYCQLSGPLTPSLQSADQELHTGASQAHPPACRAVMAQAAVRCCWLAGLSTSTQIKSLCLCDQANATRNPEGTKLSSHSMTIIVEIRNTKLDGTEPTILQIGQQNQTIIVSSPGSGDKSVPRAATNSSGPKMPAVQYKPNTVQKTIHKATWRHHTLEMLCLQTSKTKVQSQTPSDTQYMSDVRP